VQGPTDTEQADALAGFIIGQGVFYFPLPPGATLD
jgi:hypothetical protein